MRSRAIALALAASLSTLAPAALGQTQTAAQKSAQALFDAGMALLKAGKVGEACPKLAESQKIDPGMATQFRLAECYEKLGKPGLAWMNFREVAEQAHREKMADREEVARKRAEAVAATMPKLSIVVPPAVAAIAGLTIEQDGRVLRREEWGSPIPVEPGEHSVRATAPGRTSWASKRVVGAGTKVEVSVPLLETAAVVVDKKAEEKAPLPSSPPSGEKRGLGPALGIGLGAGAVAALGAGAALFVVSKGKASSAMDLANAIGRGGCTRVAPDPRCGELDDTAHGVDTFHNAAVGLLAGGGVLAAGTGAYFLWRAVSRPSAGKPGSTSPDPYGMRVTPLVGVNGGGLIISGDL